MILSRKDTAVDLDAVIDGKLETGALEEILVVVPTNRRARALKKELIAATAGGAVHHLHVETLHTLARKLALGEESEYREVDTPTAGVLISQSFGEADLNYFSNDEDGVPRGTMERIRNVITEYKRHGFTPEKLQQEAAGLDEVERRKAEDIAKVYAVYQRKFEEFKLTETGDLYAMILSAGDSLPEVFTGHFPGVKEIIVNGFAEFSILEIKLLKLISELPGRTLYINFDYFTYNKALFAHLDKCFEALKTHGFREVTDRSVSGRSPFIEHLRQNIFSRKTPGLETKFADKVFEFAGTDIYDETARIASECKKLIRDKGVEPHRIGVVFHNITAYAPAVRDTFGRYRLPYNLTDRFHLKTFLPVTALLNLVELIENDFYYKNVFRAFSGRYVEPKHTTLVEIMNTAQKLKIVSRYENWTGMIDNAIDRANDDDDDSFSRYDAAVFEGVKKEIVRLKKLLAPFDQKLTISAFLEHLQQLFHELRIPEKILKLSRGREEENIKAVAAFYETINDHFDVLTRGRDQDSTYKLHYFMKQIRTLVENTRFNVKEKPSYGIQVTAYDEIRGLHFDYLFAGGLADSFMPTRYSPEIFYSGSFSRKEWQHQLEERYLFYQALCSWRERLYLSRPGKSEKKEMVESYFLTDLKKLFKVTELPSREDEEIFTDEKLFAEIGRGKSAQYFADILPVPLTAEAVEVALRIDAVRMSADPQESIFTGYINDELSEEAAKRLAEYKDKTYSISQLELYNKCPFKYFAERMLRLEGLEEPEEDVEPMELGSLLHKILYDFFSALTRRGIVINSATDKEMREAEDLLFDLAEKNINALPFRAPLAFYELEKITGIGGDRKQSILYKALEYERLTNNLYIPAYFEAEFGMAQGSEFTLRDISLRGVIDRIDLNDEFKVFKVIDYKRSKSVPTKTDIENGYSLQLPVYIAAAESEMERIRDGNYRGVLPEIFSLRYDEDKFGGFPVKMGKRIDNTGLADDKTRGKIFDTVAEMKETALGRVESAVKGISAGRFPLTNAQNREKIVCGWCELKPVCRVSESPQESLEDL